MARGNAESICDALGPDGQVYRRPRRRASLRVTAVPASSEDASSSATPAFSPVYINTVELTDEGYEFRARLASLFRSRAVVSALPDGRWLLAGEPNQMFDGKQAAIDAGAARVVAASSTLGRLAAGILRVVDGERAEDHIVTKASELSHFRPISLKLEQRDGTTCICFYDPRANDLLAHVDAATTVNKVAAAGVAGLIGRVLAEPTPGKDFLDRGLTFMIERADT